MEGRQDEDAQENCDEPYIDRLHFFHFIYDMII